MNVVCVLLDFSNMAAAAILDFFKFEFQRSVGSRGGMCVILPNFVKISQTVAKISRFICFSKLRPSATKIWLE